MLVGADPDLTIFIDCAIDRYSLMKRILIALLQRRSNYETYFKGRLMSPIEHTSRTILKQLKAVLALWINEEAKVNNHCSVQFSNARLLGVRSPRLLRVSYSLTSQILLRWKTNWRSKSNQKTYQSKLFSTRRIASVKWSYLHLDRITTKQSKWSLRFLTSRLWWTQWQIKYLNQTKAVLRKLLSTKRSQTRLSNSHLSWS